ncbi:MAG TPA: glycosyltransferase [Candidatus Krumholzibacteriaceae bacterium]|nr:glycosyltransferase [Candidatus Krumholzibacteriaceae bacterium]
MTAGHKDSHTDLSIIIPVLNNAEGLRRTLTAVSKQRYTGGSFETIVVDNGSDDNPEEAADRFDVIYLEEHRHLSSPYSARNRGIEASKGEIIVLLDATCVPDPDWLREGVKAIKQGNDIVGGDVVFSVTEESTISELYDSIVNVRMEDAIKRRNVAKSGNLFIKKSVFDSVGLFPEGLRSGGDIRWTGKAHKSGFKLFFSEDARVTILPRPLRPLLKKQWRVARGHPVAWRERKTFLKNFIKKGILCVLPVNPATFLRSVRRSDHYFIRRKWLRLFLFGCFIRLVMGIAVFYGTFQLLRTEE